MKRLIFAELNALSIQLFEDCPLRDGTAQNGSSLLISSEYLSSRRCASPYY